MTRFDEFWEVMCRYTHYLWLGVMMMLFLFILSVMALFFADPGTGSFAINLVNMLLILTFGSVIFGMFYMCNRRQNRAY